MVEPQTTQPTPAAMRAARKLHDALPVGCTPECVAAIIDRETGLPELLAACNAARERLGRGLNEADELLEELEAAAIKSAHGP